MRKSQTIHKTPPLIPTLGGMNLFPSCIPEHFYYLIYNPGDMGDQSECISLQKNKLEK